MSAVVVIGRLKPADSKRDALIGLLREFAESINGSSQITLKGQVCAHR
jgi:hypothetical protein